LDLGDVTLVLSTLPREQRTVMALVVLDGMSYAEAADALGVPVGTVMSRLARARAALAARLAPTPTPFQDVK
jgi:RNA polymerase sigma-70 factor (ECF subfamily)